MFKMAFCFSDIIDKKCSSQEQKAHLSNVFIQAKLPCPCQIGTFNIIEEEKQ